MRLQPHKNFRLSLFRKKLDLKCLPKEILPTWPNISLVIALNWTHVGSTSTSSKDFCLSWLRASRRKSRTQEIFPVSASEMGTLLSSWFITPMGQTRSPKLGFGLMQCSRLSNIWEQRQITSSACLSVARWDYYCCFSAESAPCWAQRHTKPITLERSGEKIQKQSEVTGTHASCCSKVVSQLK